MRVVADVAQRVAIACAVLLLFGPLSDRTVWVRAAAGGGTRITDAAGYPAAAFLSGLAVLAILAAAHAARPRVVVPVLGAVAAVAAFGLSVFVSGLGAVARWQGRVWFYGGGGDFGPTKGWTVYPADGPPVFFVVALVGAVAALALAIAWLRLPSGGVDPPPAWMTGLSAAEATGRR
jgi:hypothetical protein